jgi:hypothetical protein
VCGPDAEALVSGEGVERPGDLLKARFIRGISGYGPCARGDPGFHAPGREPFQVGTATGRARIVPFDPLKCFGDKALEGF